ncbi:MAG: EamA family transporter, partial [Acidobacteria bacterium]|nr:EamA family transporter [Acidobacteriota bacterium]
MRAERGALETLSAAGAGTPPAASAVAVPPVTAVAAAAPAAPAAPAARPAPAAAGRRAAGVSPVHVALALATVYVLWGSTYLGMRLAIATIPPFTMAAIRHFTAGALLYAFARLRGAPRPQPLHWRSAAIIGALLLLLGNGGVVWAEQRLSSGMAALLISSEPMWIVLFAWLRRDGRRPSPLVVAGLLVGMAGLALLVRPGIGGGAAVDPLGVAAVLISSISWAAGSLYVQRATLPSSPLLATSMQMLCGGALLFATGALTGEPARFALSRVSTGSALAVLYLVVFGSLIGYTTYTWLLRSASPVLVSTYAYVNPVVAVFLGWALVSEPVTPGMLAGAAVILGGVALISTASSGGAARRQERGEQLRRQAAAASHRQLPAAAPERRHPPRPAPDAAMPT